VSPADRDLKLMAAVACLAVLTAFTVDTPVVRTLPALLMLLVVPGYALSVALLPAPRDVFERCLIALGLSLCVDVLGGLLIDRTGFGLTSRAWSVSLALLALPLCVVAAGRRSAIARPAPARVRKIRRHAPRGTERTVSAPAAISAGALAVAAVVGALLIARLPSSSAQVRGYTELWIVPVNATAGTYSIGVRSEERHRTSYRLLATSLATGRVVTRRDMTLAPGRQQTIRGRLTVSRNAISDQVSVKLYRVGHLHVAYRQVFLTLEAPSPTS